MLRVLLFSIAFFGRLYNHGLFSVIAYDYSDATLQHLDALEAELNTLMQHNQDALQGIGHGAFKPAADFDSNAADQSVLQNPSLEELRAAQLPSAFTPETVPSFAQRQQLQQQLQQQQLQQRQQQQQQQRQQQLQQQQLWEHQQQLEQQQQQQQHLQQLLQQQELIRQQVQQQEQEQQRMLALQQRRQQLLRLQQEGKRHPEEEEQQELQLLQLRQQKEQQRKQQELRQEQRQHQTLAMEQEQLVLQQQRMDKRVRELQQTSQQLAASQRQASEWLRNEEQAASQELHRLRPPGHLHAKQARKQPVSLLESYGRAEHDESQLLRGAGVSGPSTIRVDDSFCNPSCQAGHGVCVGSISGGALSAPARCLCEKSFSGASCEIQGDEKPRHATLKLALPETVAKVWKQHNPALAGVLLEAPISFVVNSCGVLIVLVASILGCWSLDKARQGHNGWNGYQGYPEAERHQHGAAVQRSHNRAQQSSGPAAGPRQQSTFFRYPGAECPGYSNTAGVPAAQRSKLDAPRRASRGCPEAYNQVPREARMHGPASCSARTSHQYVQDVPEYLDDDPEDWGGNGFVDDDCEDLAGVQESPMSHLPSLRQ